VQEIDPLDYWSAAQKDILSGVRKSFLNNTENYNSKGVIALQEVLEVVNNYLTLGDFKDAEEVLSGAITFGEPYASSPLAHYYMAYIFANNNDMAASEREIENAKKLSPLHNYPLRIEEIALFNKLLEIKPEDSYLNYHLGNLLYYLGQKDAGLALWKKSADLNPSFAIACRNVGFGYGCLNNYDEAIKYYQMAVKANSKDPLLLTELDKIYEKANIPDKDRLKMLESNIKTVMMHDDAVMRLLGLYNSSGKYDKAIKILDERHFHLWEGGGYVHNLYADAHMLKRI
jgi:Tetratricopeptide repeat.